MPLRFTLSKGLCEEPLQGAQGPPALFLPPRSRDGTWERCWQARPRPQALTPCAVLWQVIYKEKDSDSQPRFWLVEGNSSRSAQLTGLGKYVLYEVQVLAFTRIGDGSPSHPPILERTLDDGKFESLCAWGGWELFFLLPARPCPSGLKLCPKGNGGIRLLLWEAGHRGPPTHLKGIHIADCASLRKKWKARTVRHRFRSLAHSPECARKRTE